MFEHSTGVHYRGRQGPLTVPGKLGDVITGVFGIDKRPRARAHLRQSATPAQPYTPTEIAARTTSSWTICGSEREPGGDASGFPCEEQPTWRRC